MKEPFEKPSMTDEDIEKARQDRVNARIEEAEKTLNEMCSRLKLIPVCIETRANGQLQPYRITFVEAR